MTAKTPKLNITIPKNSFKLLTICKIKYNIVKIIIKAIKSLINIGRLFFFFIYNSKPISQNCVNSFIKSSLPFFWSEIIIPRTFQTLILPDKKCINLATVLASL